MVISTAPMTGFPALLVNVPWASIVVLWGIDAMRANVAPSAGVVVAGTLSQIPGSK
jgi:hypothetical protein